MNIAARAGRRMTSIAGIWVPFPPHPRLRMLLDLRNGWQQAYHQQKYYRRALAEVRNRPPNMDDPVAVGRWQRDQEAINYLLRVSLCVYHNRRETYRFYGRTGRLPTHVGQQELPPFPHGANIGRAVQYWGCKYVAYTRDVPVSPETPDDTLTTFPSTE